MSEPIFEWMQPSERMARDRRNKGVVEKLPRPCDVAFELSGAEQEEVNKLLPDQRLTRYGNCGKRVCRHDKWYGLC
jgi:hypothetical protein